MRIWKIARSIGKVLLALATLVVAIVALSLGYRSYQQRQIASAMAITTPNGIEESLFVRIGGIDQWITIRGSNRDNPVLLYLMGGPGDSIIPRAYALYHSWEGAFTVVQWDQRGSGRTYTKNGEVGSGTLSIPRAVEDTAELSQYLRQHLHKEKILLFGVSWGTLLGVETVKAHPDLFCAYVGSGQFVNGRENEEIGYAALLSKVRSVGDKKALADLERIGPSYYEDRDRLHIERGWLRKYMAPPSEQSMTSKTLKQMYFAPGYSLSEYLDFDAGTMFSLRDLWPSVVKTDLRTLGPDFNVPVFIFQGADDYQTPTALAQSYYDSISAPKKEFVLVEGAGHFVSLVMPDRILQELVHRVRPVALESGC